MFDAGQLAGLWLQIVLAQLKTPRKYVFITGQDEKGTGNPFQQQQEELSASYDKPFSPAIPKDEWNSYWAVSEATPKVAAPATAPAGKKP